MRRTRSRRSHACKRTISFERITKEVFNYRLSKTYRISEKGNKSYIELKKKRYDKVDLLALLSIIREFRILY